MTDNELLLSISNIMDKKLYPLEKTMDAFDEKLDKLETKLTNKIDTVEQNLKHSIRLINLTLENNVVPRLNEIESCYISTSERYQRETDKIISLDSDMSVAKSVILEHSNKLAALGA